MTTGTRRHLTFLGAFIALPKVVIVDVFVIEKLMRCLGINSIFRGFAIIV